MVGAEPENGIEILSERLLRWFKLRKNTRLHYDHDTHKRSYLPDYVSYSEADMMGIGGRRHAGNALDAVRRKACRPKAYK